MGILIAILGFYFFFFVLDYLGGVVIAVGAYFMATGFRTPSHRQISGKVNQVIYSSLMERGTDELSELMLLESDIKKRRFELPEGEVKAMLGEFYATTPGSD